MSSGRALGHALASRESISIVLIDADHQADFVMDDLRWARLVHPGGFVCLHDYSDKFPGVAWAVERFLQRNRHYRKVAVVSSLVVLQKQRASDRSEVTLVDRAAALAARLSISARR